MKKPIKLAINFAAIAVVVAGLAVGNNILFQFEKEISSALAPAIVDESSLNITSASGQEMSKKIVQEGSVLFKNDNNTLPLDYESVRKVNVFGWRSIDWIYGSEGQNASGGVAPEDDDFSKNIDIYKALNNYGIQYNTRLYNMYYDYFQPLHQSANLKGNHISNILPLREPKIEDTKYYSTELLDFSKSYSDTALVVIGRMSGEGMNCSSSSQKKQGPGAIDDNTRHYLELSTEEESLLKYCGQNFENVIVLLNVSNTFELGFLNTIEGIDACLYLGFTGTRGADGIPSLLYGDVTPSGKTVDTFAYDLFTNPANYWQGDNRFSDYNMSYTDYVEGIYVGYKWYETADVEGVWDDVKSVENGGDNLYGNGYEGIVQFPFGFGMSYTDFSWNVDKIELSTDSEENQSENFEEVDPANNTISITDYSKIRFTVDVTNTGNYSGQDVVEIYVSLPYYEGEIEKSSIQLMNYAKTNILEPGATETITVTVDANDFASYDCYDKNNNEFTGYELESGNYLLKLQTDSHNLKDITYKNNTSNSYFTFSVDEDIQIRTDKITGKEVKNLFTGDSAIDCTPIDGSDSSFTANVPWFTRTDFKKPNEFESIYVASREANPSSKISRSGADRLRAWDNATVDAFGEEVDTSPVTWGANNNLKLAENGVITDLGRKLSEDFNDEQWNDVLDQLSINEVKTLINRYYGSSEIASVGKPKITDLDGPAQIKGFLTAPRGTGYPTMVTVTQTWNQKLLYDFGKAFGDDMKSVGVVGVWGWAIDLHRNAWFGRNHESPSEDAMLAGRTIAAALKGLNTRGRTAYLKHFALYGATGDNHYMSEQTLRETYLASFRRAFLEGEALGCMTTYQGVGAEHSETTEGLLTGVLRREWDFKGSVTTDYIGDNSYCDSIIRFGGNYGMGVGLGTIGINYDESSPIRLQHRLREVAHEVLYTWLRTDYQERKYLENPDKDEVYISSTSINSWEWWKPLVYTIDTVVSIGLATWAILILIGTFVKDDKKKKLENKVVNEKNQVK